MATEPCGSKAARACWPQRGVQNQSGVGGLDGLLQECGATFHPRQKDVALALHPAARARMCSVCAWSERALCTHN